MNVSLAPGQSVPFTVSPVIANGSPSNATLSKVSFTTDDAAVATVAADPSTPNGGILTATAAAVIAATTNLHATATATEPDGKTTEQIQGIIQVVIAQPVVAPATALVFTFGTPTP